MYWKQCRWLVFASLMLLLNFSALGSITSAPDTMIEIFPVSDEYDITNQPYICYRITNISDKSYDQYMPHEFCGLIWDWFDVYFNGIKLRSKIAEMDFSFTKKTSIMPNESVTICFRLEEIFELPKGDARNGYYEVSMKSDGNRALLPMFAANKAIFKISNLKKDELMIEMDDFLEKNSNIDSFCKTFLSSSKSSPAEKVKLLKILHEKKPPALFKEYMQICKEPYAQVMLLKEKIIKNEDKELFLELINSKDLSVRRESLRCLAKIEQDTDIKEQVKKLLSTRDEIVNDLVQEILSK